jgi:riboflavin biosynthesis pyrimidine reductase
VKVVELSPLTCSLDINPVETALEQVEIWYPRILGARFNYVIAVNEDEGSNSNIKSNSIDRYFLRAIRSVSDLIITTGRTARSEHLRNSRFAPMAILTNSPDDIDIPATSIQSKFPLVICSTKTLTSKYTNQNVEFLSLDTEKTPKAVTDIVKHFGSKAPLFETGLSTATELVAGNLIDEVCLSVTGSVSKDAAKVLAQELLNKIGCRAELVQLLESNQIFLFRFEVLKQTS